MSRIRPEPDLAGDSFGVSLHKPQPVSSLPGATQLSLQGALSSIRFFTGYIRDYSARSDSYHVLDPLTNNSVICSALHPYGATGTAMGARTCSGGYPPQTPVHVLEIAGERIILGVALASTANLKNLTPGMIVMRAQVGASDPKAPMHTNMLKQDAGLSYRDVGRPLDVMAGDWGHINELGVAFFLGRMMAMFRASDVAKIEAFWGDDLLRIFGYNLQTYTAIREEYEISDEGEGNLVRRSSPFAWEAIGAKDVLVSAVDEKEGRSKDPEGNAWWEPKENDQLIIPRHVLMRGYMGDLDHEWVVVPGKSMPSEESFGNSTKYLGVLEIVKNITGAYLVRSAKEITLEKSILIPVPKELKAPDDPTGDNRTNYHAAGSSALGDGEDLPQLQEYEYPDMADANGWAAYLYEVQAWMYNRVVIGGLYLHTGEFGGMDWYLPAERDLQGEFNESVESANINPSKLDIGNTFMVKLPELAKLKVDHREGHEAVRYYQSRSCVKMQEDGGILIEDGYGSSIQMKGGSIFLSCVGDIFMQPGRNIINWAPRDFIAKAGNCVDITSSLKDIHIKAEKNLEFISGNGSDGNGAMIFDCRSEGNPAQSDFTEIGEDRKTKGILIKAADSPIDIFGTNCYLGITQPKGRVTLDGGNLGQVYLRGDEVKMRTRHFNVISPKSKELLQLSEDKLFLNTAINYLAGYTYFKKGVRCSYLEVQGLVNCTSSVYAEGHFGSLRGGPVGKGPKIPLAYPTSQTIQKEIDTQYDKVNAETTTDESEVVESNDAPGNKEFQARVHFSCRTTKQYFGGQEGTFFLWETRWQNLLSQSGGSTWAEPEVLRTGTGQPEMPHPGREAWEEQQKYKRLDSPDNYDDQTGIAKARSSLTYQGKQPEQKKLSEAYVINTQT